MTHNTRMPPGGHLRASPLKTVTMRATAVATSLAVLVASWPAAAQTQAKGPPLLRDTLDAERIKALELEVRELRRANAILKSASAFFAAELDRPQR